MNHERRLRLGLNRLRDAIRSQLETLLHSEGSEITELADAERTLISALIDSDKKFESELKASLKRDSTSTLEELEKFASDCLAAELDGYRFRLSELSRSIAMATSEDEIMRIREEVNVIKGLINTRKK